jgi:hypothetical protein
MAERRRYTARQRAKAAGIGAVEGVTEAERQTGIPKETIQYWLTKPEFAQLRTTARETVVDQFWVGIQVGLEQVVAGFKGDAPLKDKASALGTLYDRHALLTGGATGRTESRDLTGTISDSELSAAIREAEQITTGGGSTSPDQDAPEG